MSSNEKVDETTEKTEEKIEKKDEVKEEKNTKKEKKSKEKKVLPKKTLIIILIAVGAVALGIGIYFLISSLFSGGSKDYALVYMNNDQLVLWKNEKEAPFVLESEYGDSSLNITYGKKNHNLIAYVSDDSLYIFNVSNGQKEKISSNVDEYSFISFAMNDTCLVFQDQEYSIYTYNLKTKSKNKIHSVNGSSERIYVEAIENDKILFNDYISVEGTDEDGNKDTKKQYNYYIYDLKTNNKNKIISDYDSKRINTNKTKLAYILKNDEKKYSLYVYDLLNGKSDKIITDIYSVLDANYDDFSTFVYLKESDEKLLIDDEGENAPVKKTEKTTKCTYSLYYADKCSFNDYWYDKKVKIVDIDDKKETNKKMLEYADDIKIYDIYVYKNGKSEKLVSNVLRTYGTSKDGNKLVYSKLSEIKQVKTSEYKTYDEFKKYLDSYIKDNTKMFYQDKSKEYTLDPAEENAQLVNVFLDDEAYAIYKKENSDSNDLYQISIEDEKVKLTLLDSNVYTIQERTNYGVLYIINDKTYYSLKLINKGQVDEIANKMQYYYMNDDKIYMFDDCNNSSCQYSVYDGKKKTLQSDVSDVVRINDNNMYIFKNYSKSKETYDIYKYKNGKMIQVAFDVSIKNNSIYAIKALENDYLNSFNKIY